MSEPSALPQLDTPPKGGVWIDGEDHFTEENASTAPAPAGDRVDGKDVTT